MDSSKKWDIPRVSPLFPGIPLMTSHSRRKDIVGHFSVQQQITARKQITTMSYPPFQVSYVISTAIIRCKNLLSSVLDQNSRSSIMFLFIFSVNNLKGCIFFPYFSSKTTYYRYVNVSCRCRIHYCNKNHSVQIFPIIAFSGTHPARLKVWQSPSWPALGTP